jgi:cytochrome c oxidase subunit IV
VTVTRAWGLLIALSALSTAIAASGLSGRWLAALVLPIAWAKAQVILNRYLGLAQAPAIARGFALVLGLFMALLIGLAVLPAPVQV